MPFLAACAKRVPMAATNRCDVAIVGGGLAGGLIAHVLAVKRPELSVRLIEAAPHFGGNHIWSFFANDIAAEHRWIIDPFVSKAWNGYSVAFPGHRRTLGVRYNSIRSERFDEVLRGLIPPDVPLHAKVARVAPTRVVLGARDAIEVGGVIDARGPGDIGLLQVGWQKFLGREVRTAAPHGLTEPIVMDATVKQADGYRFVYVLPFAEDRLFIEDTYYSNLKNFDKATLGRKIDAYADAKGWRIAETIREEAGALPVTLDGDFEAYWRSGGEGVAKAGMRAGLFNPVTGYSLPDAVRFAAHIATLDDLSGGALHEATHDYARKAWADRGFYRMLNKMVFRGAADDERFRIFERFYRLSPGLIERFYSARSTNWDKLRILTGKPPIPISRGIRAIMETGA